jgi:hypothetical protein
MTEPDSYIAGTRPHGLSHAAQALYLKCLTDEERLRYANLKRVKDMIQPQLGVSITDISVISTIVHEMHQLETMAILRYGSDTPTKQNLAD